MSDPAASPPAVTPIEVKPEDVPQPGDATDDDDDASPTGEASPDSPKRKKKTSLKTRAGSDRDDGHSRTESHPRGQLIASDGVVRLSGTIRIYQEKMENRFVNDFVPAPPTLGPGEKGDPLVTSTLQQFASDNVVLARIRHKFEKVMPPKSKFVTYEVDEAHKLNKKAHKDEKKKVDISNMFANPTGGSAHNTATGLQPVASTADHSHDKDKDKDHGRSSISTSHASTTAGGDKAHADPAHPAAAAGADAAGGGGTLRSRRMMARGGAGAVPMGAADALAGLMAAFNNPAPATPNATTGADPHHHHGSSISHSTATTATDSHSHGADSHRGSSSSSTGHGTDSHAHGTAAHAGAAAGAHGHHPSVSHTATHTPSSADHSHGHGHGHDKDKDAHAHGHGHGSPASADHHGHADHHDPHRGSTTPSHSHGGGHGGKDTHAHDTHGKDAHAHGKDAHAHGKDAHAHGHRDSHGSHLEKGHHHEKSHGGSAHGTHDGHSTHGHGHGHDTHGSKDGSEHDHDDGEHPDDEKEEPEIEPEAPPEEDEKSLQPTNLVDVQLQTQPVSAENVQKILDEEQKESMEDGLFWRFHPEFDYKENAEVTICKRVPVPMWERDLGMQLLVSVSSLKVNGGILIEPFYCTLALYDLKHGYKLSENFHFDLNDPTLVPLSLANTPRKPPDEITLCKHAILSVSDRHENVFLVLKIERILQESQDLDIYTKTKNRSASELANLRKKYGMSIQQLQDYRRAFAWGLVPLFEDTGELITEGQMQLIDKLYILPESLKDADFMKMARETVDTHVDKKAGKMFPNSYFEFRLDEIDADYPANRVDPSTIPLKNSPELLELKVKPRELKENEHPIVLEVQEFAETAAPIPNSYFVNLLYIYPEFIEFEKFRNICCKVQVRESDASLSGGALEMIAGRSSGPAYVKELLTAVNYHLKATPQNDEIKVMLPLKIAQKAHIFFTFYKVSCKKKPGKREIIGYSILPLYTKHQWLPDNVYNLPIAAMLPENNYYQGFVDGKENEQVHFRRNGNPCFQVRVKLVSSLFCQDKALNDFFFTFPSEKELEGAGHQHGAVLCQQAVDHFKEVSPITAIRFLPGITSHLLEQMYKRPDDLAQYYSLVGLVYVVDRVSQYVNEANRCALLVSWLTHRFRNLGEQIPLWPRVMHLWLSGLKKREEREVGAPDSPVDRLFIQYAWFFFEIIFKSMALHKNDSPGNALPAESVQYFVRTFEDILILFTRLMYRHRSTGLTALKHLVNNLALFFTDLFTILDSPTVLHLLEVFMFEFREVRSDPVLVEFKFTFYGILFDNEYFLDMVELKPMGDDEDPVQTVKTRYRLVAMFIEDYAKNLQLSELIIREKVINSLRYVLTKYDYDSRYQQSREKIAMLFLPLLPAMLEEMNLIREMDIKLQRSALISVLWVIKHVSPKVLSQWWKREDPDVLADFVSLLDLCLTAFQYAGIKVRENENELQTILSPESMSSFIEGGEVPQGTVGDFKSNIESLMSNIHKSHSFKAAHHTPTGSLLGEKKATSRSRLRAAKENASSLSLTGKGSISGSSKADPKNEKKGSRFSLGTSNKSSLRALRAKMANRRTGTFKRGSSTNTLTTTSRDYLLKLVRWEGALNRNVSRVVLKTLQHVVDDFASEMTISDPSAHPSDVLVGVVNCFTSLLKYNQPTTVLLSLFPYLRLFCQRFGKACFQNKHMHRHLTTMVGQVFRHGTFTSRDVRKESIATSICFLMQNLAADGHLGYLEVSLTVHMSKLVNEINDRGERYLKQVLGAVKEIAPQLTIEDPEKSARFHSDLNTLLGRLSTILADSSEIARQEKLGAEAADPTTAENLIVQVADAFSHMPEIRIEWLSRLGHHHHDTGNFAEAGQCFKQIAELYASPAMEQQLAEQAADAAWKNITAYYELACKMLDKAELYEQCAEVYRALLPMYEQKRENKYLARSFLHLHQIYEKLIKADAEESRSLGSYYRVGFYGKKFGDRLNGNEFVYKMPKITTLGEAMNRLKKVYSAQLGKEVTVIPYSGPIDTSAHNEETAMMQVTFVSPWFDKNNKTGGRRTYIEKHTNIDAFKFSTPFTKGKKTQASSLQEQYKRNVVLFVKNSFPCTMTAQPVIRKQETVMTPIETAISDIKSRTRKMNAAANAEEPSAKTLTALLQGAVAPQVHGGTKEICYAFLEAPPGLDKSKTMGGASVRGPPRASVSGDAPHAADSKPEETKTEDAPSPEQQFALRQALRDFKMACQHVLDANRKLALLPDAQLYQTEMDGHFDRMCATLEPWIIEAKKSKSAKGKPARRAVRFG